MNADRKKPFEGDSSQSAIDFDSFDAETLNRHDFVVTTAAAFTSKAPPSFELVDQTAYFQLWRRTGEVFDRPILNESALPARLVDCSRKAAGTSPRLEGEAVLLPETVLGLADDWQPSPGLAPEKRLTEPRPRPRTVADIDPVLHPGRDDPDRARATRASSPRRSTDSGSPTRRPAASASSGPPA